MKTLKHVLAVPVAILAFPLIAIAAAVLIPLSLVYECGCAMLGVEPDDRLIMHDNEGM